MIRLDDAWVRATPTQAVMAMLTDGGFQAFFVGGCVRNALLKTPVADIDIATDAHPDTVMDRAAAAGLHAVPTGIDHGTVTVVSDGLPHEVTTYRQDVATDGRRAVVRYSDDIAVDAARRDFTMNALYADASGKVVDPLGGLPDLRAGRVRFIGDAADRIAEDALRILRFFRFTAIYGHDGLDPEGLAASAQARDKIADLSRERVGAEIARLLAAPDPAPVLAAMSASGILAATLPGADPRLMAPLVHLEQTVGIAPTWRRRLAALGGEDWSQALRLSRKDATFLRDLRLCLSEGIEDHVAAERFGAEIATDAALVRAASAGGPLPENWQKSILAGAEAVFPLRAADLDHRYPPGPALGQALTRLHDAWVASRFQLDKAGLLAIDSPEDDA